MLIEAWASLKSFRPKEDDDDDSNRRDSDGTPGSDKNPWMNFKGEKCKNDTRESPEALAVAVFHEGVSGERHLRGLAVRLAHELRLRIRLRCSLVQAHLRWGGDRASGRSATGTQPGNAAACFTHVAICASSSLSPSRMSM
jgi:hypothetical protein